MTDIECWLTDMDGVLVHENHPIPGASDLLQHWQETERPTSSSRTTPSSRLAT